MLSLTKKQKQKQKQVLLLLLWHTGFVAETTAGKAGMALPRSGYL